MSFVIGELTARVDANTNPFNQRINQVRGTGNTFISNFGSSLQTLGSKMTAVGGALAKSITLPLAAAGVAVLKLGSDFESSMEKIIGLVGVSRDQVELWKKELIKLGPELGKSPNELADALFFITSAGIKGAEALDVLTMSAKASAVGLGETNVVADLVTSAMNAYGKENLSASQATDILVAAVREGKAEASALASAMGGVLPIASAMGVEFDEVSAAIAAMTRTGTDANTASVQLKAILASLLKPSKEAADTLDMMGTSAEKLRKKLREEGLLSTLIELDRLTKKYGEETVAKVFPNIRALSGFLDLMGSNVEDNVKIFDSLKNSTGMLDEAFKGTSETLEFKFNQSLSQLKATAISFFDVMKKALIPILDKFTKVLGDVTNKFSKLSVPQQEVILGLAGIAGTLPLVILGFGKLIGFVGGTIELLSLVGGTLAGIGAPALIAIGVIGSLVVGFAGLILSSEKVRKAIKDNFGGIVEKVKESARFIIENFDEIKKAFGEFVEALNTGEFGDFTVTMSKLVPQEFLDDLHQGIIKFVEFRDRVIEVRDNLIDFGERIMKFLAPVLKKIGEIFKDMQWEEVSKSITDLKEALEPSIPIWENLLTLVIDLGAAISGSLLGNLVGLISAIPNFIAALLDLVLFFVGLFDLMLGTITNDGDLMLMGWQKMWKGITGTIGNAIVGIIKYFENLWKTIFKYFSSMNKNIGDELCPSFVKKIKSEFSKIPEAWTHVKKLYNVTKSIFTEMKNTSSMIVSKLVNDVLVKLKSIASGALKFTKNFTSASKELAKALVDGLKQTNFYKAGQNIIKSIIKGLKSYLKDLKATAGQIGTAIRNYLPFSPAKEGPLKDLDKLNFGGPIIKSLNKAKDDILGDWLGNLILGNPPTMNENIASVPATAGTNINGTFNFYGVQNVEDFMKEMNTTIRRYGGRIFE